ncbi:MAG: AAA family ATPase [Pseudomonadota bacterium]
MSKMQITVSYMPRSQDQRSPVNAALLNHPSVSLTQLDGSLSEINGQAVDIVHGSQVVMFETGVNAKRDIAAIQALRSILSPNVPLIGVARATDSLADVRQLTGAGVDDVIPDAMDTGELFGQLEGWVLKRSAELLRAAPGLATDAKVIAVARSRGGIGATTVAVNVADALLGRQGTFRKRTTNKVALVDLDLQFGAVASHLDIDGGEATYQMILDGTIPDETFLDHSMVTHRSGVSVLPAPSSFVPLDALTNQQVARTIEVLRAKNDFVVIDLPLAIIDWLAAVIEHSDELLLVTDSSVPSVRQSKRLIDFFTAENIGLEVTMVINHEKKPVLAKRHHTEAAQVLEREFRHWLPFDPKSAREACDRGVPLSEAASQSGLTKALNRLGRSVAETKSHSLAVQH